MNFVRLIFLLPICVFALNSTHLNDYLFLSKGRNLEFEGYFSPIGKAEFRTKPYEHDHILYTEAGGSAYFGGHVNRDNCLCAQVGYAYMNLNWNENPSFSKKVFQDLIVSLAYVTTAVPQWRWVIDLGAHIDTAYFNLAQNTFYTGIIWGRLFYTRTIGVHFGFLGSSGVKNTYLLPIIGMDFYLSPKVKLNAVFPLDLSIAYLFNKDLEAAICYRAFGGWYRANHRVSPGPTNPEGSLVTQSIQGVDLGLYYNRYNLSFAFYGGYSINGWLLIQNPNHSNSHYYKFKGAPYVGAQAELAF